MAVENSNDVTNIIKCVINYEIGSENYNSIILFGSRAIGKHNKFSDYDILIVLKKDIEINNKINVSTALRKELARNGIDADIILKSQNEVNYYKDKIGSIVKLAIDGGTAL